MCGSSGAQKAAYANEQKISSLMSGNFQKIFGDNSAILKSITGALSPIVAAGPSQFGFSPQETAAMRTQTAELNAAAGQQATNALRGSLAAVGGGTQVLPSGSMAALEGDLALKEASKEATDQAGITQRGYETGRQNFFNAEGRLVEAPSALENPEIAAGNSALTGAKQQQDAADAETAASRAWISPVMGVAGALLGPAGAAVGQKLGNFISGSGGSDE